MSDYQQNDGRPAGPLRPCTVGDEAYVYHHDGLVGLEVSPFDPPGSPAVTLGLSSTAARYLARELLARADEVDGQTTARQ